MARISRGLTLPQATKGWQKEIEKIIAQHPPQYRDDAYLSRTPRGTLRHEETETALRILLNEAKMRNVKFDLWMMNKSIRKYAVLSFPFKSELQENSKQKPPIKCGAMKNRVDYHPKHGTKKTPKRPSVSPQTVADELGLDVATVRKALHRREIPFVPGDEWASPERIAEIVDTLIAGRFYEPYEVDGKQYLHTRNFAKYQEPDHPTAPRCSLYPGRSTPTTSGRGTDGAPKRKRELYPNLRRRFHKRTGNVLAGLEVKVDLEVDLEV
jgi:hypothetical protein